MKLTEAIEKCQKLVTTKFNNDYSIDSSDKEAIETILDDLRDKYEILEKLKVHNHMYKNIFLGSDN